MKSTAKLNFLSVFSLAAGGMISSGLFVLPAIIYHEIGSKMTLTYALASVIMIPAMFSTAELGTAMPKGGGTYFYVGRSMGSMMGYFAGLANWLTIALKGSFALMGMGVFVEIFIQDVELWQIKAIAIILILVFTIFNLVGIEESGNFQIVLVLSLIAILIFFNIGSFISVDSLGIEISRSARELQMSNRNWLFVFAIAGEIFISFGGLTKIATVASQIKNPGKTLPLGMFTAFFVVSILYVLTVHFTLRLVDPETLANSYTPLSLAAAKFSGSIGFYLLTIAALFAFATTANASIMSASQVPVAMANDFLLPSFFKKQSRRKQTPYPAILFTALFMVLIIILLDLATLVKLASTMMLVLFIFINIAVILMRESRLVSYRPLYRSHFYPFMQVLGILFYSFLIIQMGTLTFLATLGFFLVSTIIYFVTTKQSPKKDAALFHIVERVIARDLISVKIEDELTHILHERDNITEDRFDNLIREAIFLDIKHRMTKDELFNKIAMAMALKTEINYELIYQTLLAREESSTTALSDFLAIPHVTLDIGENVDNFVIVVLRCKDGVYFDEEHKNIRSIFSLAGSKEDKNFHLKSLMAIAQIIQSDHFEDGWNKALNEEELRNLILITKRTRD